MLRRNDEDVTNILQIFILYIDTILSLILEYFL